MSALFWIRNDKPWRQYVANRVSEIRQLTSRDDWRHCPGNLNLADLPSRGLTGDQLVKSSLWWEGPSFLRLAETEWPHNVISSSDEMTFKELVKNPPQSTHTLMACNSVDLDTVLIVADSAV